MSARCKTPCDAPSASAESEAPATEPVLLCCEARASDASAACAPPPVDFWDTRPGSERVSGAVDNTGGANTAWPPVVLSCGARRASAGPGAAAAELVLLRCKAWPHPRAAPITSLAVIRELWPACAPGCETPAAAPDVVDERTSAPCPTPLAAWRASAEPGALVTEPVLCRCEA